MKKKIISGLVICIVVVLAYFYAYIDKNSYVYDKTVDTGTFYSTGILLEGKEVAQTFLAEEDTIDGFRIKVSLAGNVEDVVVNYTILDADLEEASKGSVKAVQLENNKFNQLDIPRVEGTAGRQYTLVLGETGSDEQNGVAFYVEPGRIGTQSLWIAENETDGTLVVRSICHRFDLETFLVLLGIIVFIVAFMKVLYKFFK